MRHAVEQGAVQLFRFGEQLGGLGAPPIVGGLGADPGGQLAGDQGHRKIGAEHQPVLGVADREPEMGRDEEVIPRHGAEQAGQDHGSAAHPQAQQDDREQICLLYTSYPSVNVRVEYRRSNLVYEDILHNAVDFGLVAFPVKIIWC